MPQHEPWDAPATLLLLLALYPGRSLLLPSQGISSGSPSCGCFRHAMSSKRIHSLFSRGLRSALPEGQFLALMKARRFLRSHCWVVLALWAGFQSCWKTHSWPLKQDMLRCFTTPRSTSSWYPRAPVSPLSCKNEEVSPPDEAPPHQTTTQEGWLPPFTLRTFSFTSWEVWA